MEEEIPQEVKKHFEEAKKHAEEADRLAEEARKNGLPRIEVTLKSGDTSSLSKMIKTQEQADFFMKILRSL
jgi:hypothetical protein